ncbi:MAG: hypothetical protein U0350_32395 [Caldilineaceae bacterium]
MTSIASIVYMFFALHLAMMSSPRNPPVLHHASRTNPATTPRPIKHIQNVTATQTLTPTKPSNTTANTVELYHRVAARSLGESPSALAEVACTVKNRLRLSGSPLHVVLRAYFAHDRPPKPEHIEIVRKVFEGELPCPATWWYALSPQDTRRFRPHPRPVLMIKRDPRDQVWIYDR